MVPNRNTFSLAFIPMVIFYIWSIARATGLSRPTVYPMPAFAARIVFGEMADALLLASQRVEPRRLLEAGFAFAHPDIAAGLEAALAG